mgnify:CR=1 FL=1
MNYGEHYARLMGRARGRAVSGYVEVHHVLPRCMGGTDGASNLVKLTAREHYLAHLLLVRMFPSEMSLVFAAHMMTVDRYGSRYGNRKYEWLRIRHSKATAEAKRGNAYGLGTKRTAATRLKMSLAQKGNKNGVGRVFDRATRQKIADSSAGRAKSPSHAQSLSDAHLARAELLPPYRDGSKRVPGVTQRPNGAFIARARVAGRRKYLGYFADLADARAALDALC